MVQGLKTKLCESYMQARQLHNRYESTGLNLTNILNSKKHIERMLDVANAEVENLNEQLDQCET